MDHSTRWTLLAVVLGLLVAYFLWGRNHAERNELKQVEATGIAAPTDDLDQYSPASVELKPENLVIEPYELDLGTVQLNEVKTATFQLFNPTDRPISIGDIQHGCSCTEAKLDKNIVNPGERIALHATFVAQKGLNKEKAVITLQTLAPNAAMLRATILAKVHTALTVTPEMLIFGEIAAGTSKTASVIVKHEDNKPFNIKAMANENSCFEMNYRSIPDSDRTAYAVDITFNPPADAEPQVLALDLTISTDVPEANMLRVGVTGTVRSRYAFNPQSLKSERLADGTAQPLLFKIGNRDGGPIKIKRILDQAQRELKIESKEEGSILELSVTFVKPLPTTPLLRGSLIISFEDQRGTMGLPYTITMPPNADRLRSESATTPP